MAFTPRTSAPSYTDKRWINVNYNGYSNAIAVTSNGSTIPNCTGYVHGRAMEIAGVTSDNLGLSNGNANTYYSASNSIWERSSEPTLGAILCFGGTYGHVAVVEYISPDGNYIQCSESDYGRNRFSYRTRYRANNWLMQGSTVSFQGFLKNPYIDYVPPEPSPEPEPTPEPDPTGPEEPGTDKLKKKSKMWMYLFPF